jgi:integrase
MGRRSSSTIPRPVVDAAKGRERIRICGRTIWLGKAGSPVARERYHALVTAWVASDGKSIDAALDGPAFATANVKSEDRSSLSKAPPPRRSPAAGSTSAQNDQKSQAAPETLTVGGLCLRYMADVRGTRSPEELRGHSRWWRAREVTRALYSRREVAAATFGPRLLRDVRDDLARLPKRGKVDGKAVTRTRAGVNRLVREIVAMFRWGVGEELVPVATWQALTATPHLKAGQSPAREATPRKPVSDADIEATVAHLPAVLADMVRLLRITACRPDEVCRMRMADIRPDAGVLRWTLDAHKTAHHGVERCIPLGKRAADIITRWAAGKPDDAPVFSRTDRGRVITEGTIQMRRLRHCREAFKPEDIRKAVRQACTAAEITVWTPYQLRHAALTDVRLHHGIDAEIALAGWTSPRLANHYAKVSFAEGAKLARAIG